MAFVAGERDERVQALAADRDDPPVHVGAGLGRRDRTAVEQHLQRQWAFARRAQHQVDVRRLELDVDRGARERFGGLFSDLPAAAQGEMVEREFAGCRWPVVVRAGFRRGQPAFGTSRSDIRLGRGLL